jgi:hypothetical protein
MTKTQVAVMMRDGIIAGAAGGLAEVAWVSLYSGVTGGDPAILARGVTTAAGVSALLPHATVSLGISVHMALAMALGVALTFAWRAVSANRGGSPNPYPFMLAALVGVWAINFFVILPIVSPAFLTLVSYPVSLVSKLLFGVAAAEVVRRQAVASGSVRQASVVRSTS